VCSNKGISGSVATARNVVRDEDDEEPAASTTSTGKKYNAKFASNNR
jgi:hypothetical protein